MAETKKPRIEAEGFYYQNHRHRSHLNQYSMNKKKKVSRQGKQNNRTTMERWLNGMN